MSGARDVHQAALIEAAHRLGVEVDDWLEETGGDLVTYSRGGRSVRIWKGRFDDRLTAKSHFVTDDKHLTKTMLRRSGILAPEGIEFELGDGVATVEPAVRAQMSIDAPDGWVLKPKFGEYGRAILIGVETADEAMAHLRAHGEWNDWMLERFAPGDDLRIQIIGHELAAACIRRPAFVTGDGSSTLEALFERRRVEAARPNPHNRLEFDEETRRMLRAQRIEMSDVPEAGREVVLKSTANMAKGGIAIDVTDELHAGYGDWCREISELFEMEICAIDAVAADRSAPPHAHATVIEVNSVPDWLHHTFSERRQHDIPRRILEYLLDTDLSESGGRA